MVCQGLAQVAAQLGKIAVEVAGLRAVLRDKTPAVSDAVDDMSNRGAGKVGPSMLPLAGLDVVHDPVAEPLEVSSGEEVDVAREVRDISRAKPVMHCQHPVRARTQAEGRQVWCGRYASSMTLKTPCRIPNYATRCSRSTSIIGRLSADLLCP